jgi:DNA-binding MarR family transcriptional regulator
VDDRSKGQRGLKAPGSVAFLLAQIGAHAAMRFGERMAEIELTPAHAGILRTVATQPGISQQELSSYLGMLPSRLVPFIDELEARGLLERRDKPDDRRVYALHLANKGARVMGDIARIARAHDDATCAALTPEERKELLGLLQRVADQQGLTRGVHPGFGGAIARSRPTKAQDREQK